jgi:hypothetical protein
MTAASVSNLNFDIAYSLRRQQMNTDETRGGARGSCRRGLGLTMIKRMPEAEPAARPN